MRRGRHEPVPTPVRLTQRGYVVLALLAVLVLLALMAFVGRLEGP